MVKISQMNDRSHQLYAGGFCCGSKGKNMNEYKDGWPRIPGWYDCLVEGEEMKLKFYVCQVSMKPHWLDKDGNYIETQYKVKWK